MTSHAEDVAFTVGIDNLLTFDSATLAIRPTDDPRILASRRTEMWLHNSWEINPALCTTKTASVL
jgi:hypothetical protein